MPDKKPKLRGNDPELTRRRPMRGARRLVVDGEVWGWRAGRTGVLVICPDGTKHNVPTRELGLHPEIQSWGHKDDMIAITTPGDVERYIRANLIQGHPSV